MKYCLGTYYLTIHLGSGLKDCAISAVCSSANRKKNLRLSFYNVQLACRKWTGSAASLGCLLLSTLSSKAHTISSAGRGLTAVSIHGASSGQPSCWGSDEKGLEKFSGTAWGREGFFLFQWDDVNKCNDLTFPTPKGMGLKLWAQSIHLISIAICSQLVMAQPATVQLRPHVNLSLPRDPLSSPTCYIFHPSQPLCSALVLASSGDEVMKMEPWDAGLKSSLFLLIHPIYTQLGWSPILPAVVFLQSLILHKSNLQLASE